MATESAEVQAWRTAAPPFFWPISSAATAAGVASLPRISAASKASSSLFFLFFSVFKPSVDLGKIYKVMFTLLVIGFALHTLGLGLRWYVSGRAPWSNGYESMIYIAWTTVLAGVLFTRKSFGGSAAETDTI